MNEHSDEPDDTVDEPNEQDGDPLEMDYGDIDIHAEVIENEPDENVQHLDDDTPTEDDGELELEEPEDNQYGELDDEPAYMDSDPDDAAEYEEPDYEEFVEVPLDAKPDASPSEEPSEIFGLSGMSILLLIVLAGCGLRIAWYLKNPALWLDEAAVVVQIVARSFGELTEPLAGHHSAPIGFLLLVKSCISMIGTHELGLRAWPLVASILGLIVTALVARKSLPKSGALIAAGLLALSWPAIGYAAELKQYSTDLMAASIMFLLGYGILTKEFTPIRIIIFGLAGAILQWFSLPLLFVLAGVGIVAGCDALLKGDTKKAGALVLAGLAWTASFAANYFVALKETAADTTLQSWHYEAFLKFPPDRSWPAALKWIGRTFMDGFTDPVGLLLPGLGMLGFIVGLITLGRRRFSWLLMLIMPMVVMLLASYLQRYPIFGRFLQFLLPALVLITGAGLGEITRVLWANGQRTFASIFIALLFVQPAMVAANELMKPVDAGIRPAVVYLKDHYAEGDSFYLHYWLHHEYAYHSDQLEGVPLEDAYVGLTSRGDWSYYRDEIASLGGNSKVWFALKEDDTHLMVGERRYFETELNRLGEQLDHQQWGGLHLYAYDLSKLEPVPLKLPTEPASGEVDVIIEGVSNE
ncbi:MAG: hypothetical protein VCD00_21105 [Candidatus Hydrogenedentota bacterium]